MTQTMQEAMGNTAREMPYYKSHKHVWALKIKAITLLDGSLSAKGSNPEEEIVGAVITPEEEGYAAFPVSLAYVIKHNPLVGGYYIVYADGYKSWSPAQAFEEGYTRV